MFDWFRAVAGSSGVVCVAMACAITGSAEAGTLACLEARFAASGDQMAYRSCGNGPIVIIVSGGPGLDAKYIQDVADMVAQAGFRAILLEPRGTGDSRAARGDGSKLTVAGSVSDIEALRRALAAPRIRLLGHSFGGAVVQAYAVAHPDRVAELILMNSVGPTMRAPAGSLDGWRLHLSPDERSAYDTARARGDRLSAMRVKFLGSFADRKRAEAFVGALADSEVHLDLQPLADSYAADYAVPGPTSRFPVTVIAGEADWIRGHEPALRATYPRARWLTVAAAGHFPWADAPVATRGALTRALRGR